MTTAPQPKPTTTAQKSKLRSRKLRDSYAYNDAVKCDTALPVDMSFNHFDGFEDLSAEYAKSNRIGGVHKHLKSNRFLTRAIWVNNNSIKNTNNLDKSAGIILEYPDTLKFLDLSFNEVTHLTNHLFKFPNISILHLHGNKIKSFSEIYKLHSLTKLHNLTLFGNPVSYENEYRQIIIGLLPQVKKLDFNVITMRERNIPMHRRVVNYLKKIGKIVDESAPPKTGATQEGETTKGQNHNKDLRKEPTCDVCVCYPLQ